MCVDIGTEYSGLSTYTWIEGVTPFIVLSTSTYSVVTQIDYQEVPDSALILVTLLLGTPGTLGHCKIILHSPILTSSVLA